MKIFDLNNLRDRAYQCSSSHGFYDKGANYTHEQMMIICEIAEAVDADRKNAHANRATFEQKMRLVICQKDDIKKDNIYENLFEKYIKDTFEDELADIVIRLCSFYGHYNVDLSATQQIIEDSKILVQETQDEEGDFVSYAALLCHSIIAPNYDLIVDKSCLFFVYRWASTYNVDLEWHIEHKMIYNELRPRMNGKMY